MKTTEYLGSIQKHAFSIDYCFGGLSQHAISHLSALPNNWYEYNNVNEADKQHDAGHRPWHQNSLYKEHEYGDAMHDRRCRFGEILRFEKEIPSNKQIVSAM